MPTELNRIKELAGLQQEAPSVAELDDKQRTASTLKYSSDPRVAYFDKMLKRYGPKLMELIIDYSHVISNNDQIKKEKLKKYGNNFSQFMDRYPQMDGVEEDFIYMLRDTVDKGEEGLISFLYDRAEQAKTAGQFSKTSRLLDPDETHDEFDRKEREKEKQAQEESAVAEAPAGGDQALAKEIAKLYKEMVEVINDNSNNPDDIESDYNWGYGPDDDEEARALMKAFNTSLQAGLQLVKKIKIERGKSLLGDESDWDPFHPQSERHDELKAMFAKYGEKFTEETAAQPVNSSVDDTIQRARAQIETLEAALKEDYKKFQGMKPYKPKKK